MSLLVFAMGAEIRACLPERQYTLPGPARRGFPLGAKGAISGAQAKPQPGAAAPMSLDALTNRIKEKVGTNSGLDATVKFDLGGDGVIFVDGKSSPNSVSNEDKDADCTISMSLENFMKLVEGDLDPTTAYMFGKLKV